MARKTTDPTIDVLTAGMFWEGLTTSTLLACLGLGAVIAVGMQSLTMTVFMVGSSITVFGIHSGCRLIRTRICVDLLRDRVKQVEAVAERLRDEKGVLEASLEVEEMLDRRRTAWQQARELAG
jgi:hypothetical protein